MSAAEADSKVKTIHVFVEVSQTDIRKVEFQTDEVTGLQIKQAAKVPVDDDLAQRVHGQLKQVQDNENVPIKEGDHFVALPHGSIS